MKEAPFYIGQKVVAIKDHSIGLFRKGEESIIRSVYEGCCGWRVTIGIIMGNKSLCLSCGRLTHIKRNVPFDAICFAPITEGFQEITYEKIREKEKVCVN